MKIHTNSAQETQEFGHRMGLFAHDGMVILLSGDLGAGKTTFTQGLALGLDIKRTVSSPTFTIMKNYHGRLDLNHIDAYRLEGLHQDLGFEERIGSSGITVIEWPDFIKDSLPDTYLRLDFKRLKGNSREIEIHAVGSDYEQLLEALT